jgi:hypothetical protein
MWVLMYIFSYSVSPAATNDKAEWRLFPNVVFQEFSSEERCKDAKSKIEVTLKHAGDRLRSGLNDLQKAGAADPAQIIGSSWKRVGRFESLKGHRARYFRDILHFCRV